MFLAPSTNAVLPFRRSVALINAGDALRPRLRTVPVMRKRSPGPMRLPPCWLSVVMDRVSFFGTCFASAAGTITRARRMGIAIRLIGERATIERLERSGAGLPHSEDV